MERPIGSPLHPELAAKMLLSHLAANRWVVQCEIARLAAERHGLSPEQFEVALNYALDHEWAAADKDRAFLMITPEGQVVSQVLLWTEF